jgi:hypothetical protein
MSAYGPGLFIKRKDGKHLEEDEKQDLETLVERFCKELAILDEELAEPAFYDYDQYKEKAISFVIFTSVTWALSDESIQQDQEETDKKTVLTIGKAIENIHPGKYAFDSYYVEV